MDKLIELLAVLQKRDGHLELVLKHDFNTVEYLCRWRDLNTGMRMGLVGCINVDELRLSRCDLPDLHIDRAIDQITRATP